VQGKKRPPGPPGSKFQHYYSQEKRPGRSEPQKRERRSPLIGRGADKKNGEFARKTTNLGVVVFLKKAWM